MRVNQGTPKYCFHTTENYFQKVLPLYEYLRDRGYFAPYLVEIKLGNY